VVEECSLTVEASDQILYVRMSARGCVNVCQLKGESRVFCFEYLCQKRRMGVLLGHGTKLYVPYTSM